MIKKSSLKINCPVGKLEHLNVALCNHVNSIYVGLSNFSARPSPFSFTIEEIELIRDVTFKKIKLYVAINNPIEPHLQNDAIQSIKRLNELFIDGIIISDWGLIKYIKQINKKLPIHFSVLAGIHNVATVLEANRQGISHIVLNSNLNINDLIEICNKSNNINFEIIGAGGICLFDCYRCCLRHYIGDNGFTTQCDLEIKLGVNNNWFHSKKLIQDVLISKETLEKTGINNIKIEGRTKPAYIIQEYISDLQNSNCTCSETRRNSRDPYNDNSRITKYARSPNTSESYPPLVETSLIKNFLQLVEYGGINKNTEIWLMCSSPNILFDHNLISTWDGVIINDLAGPPFLELPELEMPLQWQSPMYCIETEWDNITKRLNELNKHYNLTKIRIHDIGLLKYVKNRGVLKHLSITWDRFGWPGRVQLPLTFFEQFLNDQGVESLEFGTDQNYSTKFSPTLPFTLFICAGKIMSPIPPNVISSLPRSKHNSIHTYIGNEFFIINDSLLISLDQTIQAPKQSGVMKPVRSIAVYCYQESQVSEMSNILKNIKTTFKDVQ